MKEPADQDDVKSALAQNARAAASKQPPESTSFDRGAGMPESGRRLLAEVAQNLRQDHDANAERGLAALAALAPAHPETLRLRALLVHKRGRHAEAASLLRRALEQWPHDVMAWNNLGSALAENGDLDGAIGAFQRCVELAPQRAPPWFNLGRALDMQGRVEDAHEALVTALQCDPNHVAARVTLARVLQFMGRISDAESEYRHVLATAPDSALAWYGLSTLRTARLSHEDVLAIERVYARSDLKPDERAGAGFALAKAFEDQDRYAEGFAMLTAANALKRRETRWNAAEFSRYVAAIGAAFAQPPATAADVAQGREVIFIAGMPRSGSTLVEQILAAHPQVAGGAELETLREVLEEESARRRTLFPAWVGQARADDWARLGRRYLERTANWRTQRRIFTDKGLMNWALFGALRAMLPGARFVNCRRDPVETCLACFRSSFAKELGFTYDLTDLAAFWRDYDRALRLWHQRYPNDVYDVVHERLIVDPETEIRRLLEFCGLPFDEACLRFHEVERNVRTASAAQVREPLRSDTARAHRYGALLDPLRAMLASKA